MIEYVKMAMKSLGNRRLRSWLTMIGIFIGIAAVVSLIGLGEGLKNAVNAQFGFLGSDILSIQAEGMAMAGPPGTGVTNPLSDDLAVKLEKVIGVEAAVNRYIRSGTLVFNDYQGIGIAMSIPSGENRKIIKDMLGLTIEYGRLLKDGDNRKVVLGGTFSDGSKNGFDRAIKVGDNILLNDLKYQVVGLLKLKEVFFLIRLL